MPPINPRHSRPIDFHRWSDHPEVTGLVGEVWVEFFGELEGSNKPGPKPKARPRDILKVVWLDLYVAWTTDPDLSIGVDLNLRKWVAGSRYNALHLFKAVPAIIHRLTDAGLIELAFLRNSGLRRKSPFPLQAHATRRSRQFRGPRSDSRGRSECGFRWIGDQGLLQRCARRRP